MTEAPYAQAPTNHANVKVKGLSTGTKSPTTQSKATVVHSNNANHTADRMPRRVSRIHRRKENGVLCPWIWDSTASLTAANKGPMTTRTMYLVSFNLTANNTSQTNHSNAACAHPTSCSGATQASTTSATDSARAEMPHQPRADKANVNAAAGKNHHFNGPRNIDHASRCHFLAKVKVLMVRM